MQIRTGTRQQILIGFKIFKIFKSVRNTSNIDCTTHVKLFILIWNIYKLLQQVLQKGHVSNLENFDKIFTGYIKLWLVLQKCLTSIGVRKLSKFDSWETNVTCFEKSFKCQKNVCEHN